MRKKKPLQNINWDSSSLLQSSQHVTFCSNRAFNKKNPSQDWWMNSKNVAFLWIIHWNSYHHAFAKKYWCLSRLFECFKNLTSNLTLLNFHLSGANFAISCQLIGKKMNKSQDKYEFSQQNSICFILMRNTPGFSFEAEF